MTLSAPDWAARLPRLSGQPTAITLGNFDGVHRGHDQVLKRLIALAAERGLTPVVLTFEPHPRHLFKPEDRFSRLSSPAEKTALLHAYGVEVLTLPFDSEMARVDAEAFLSGYLIASLNARAFLLGHDHRIGAGARGDAALVRRLVPGAHVEESVPFQVEGETVSSSLIRQHLENGRPESAQSLLGRAFTYRGEVVPGAGRARQMGVPTANIASNCPEKVHVRPGVYFGMARGGEASWPALANIGYAPTFGEGPYRIEVHIPGQNLDLYGQTLAFELWHHHRGEKTFATLDALKAQITLDLATFASFSPHPKAPI